MRAFFVFVAWLVLFYSTGLSEPKTIRTETLIRRAYLDISGHVPTVEEIDWFCVYNRNSYELAVDSLLERDVSKWNRTKQQMKQMLMSEEYKLQSPRPIDVDVQIAYVVGMGDQEITPNNINIAKNKLIECARLCSNNEGEIIDYMCNALMSRSSNVQEANMLTHKFIQSSTVHTEDQAWRDVLEDILLLDEVRNK